MNRQNNGNHNPMRLHLPDHLTPRPQVEPPLMSEDPRVLAWLQSIGVAIDRVAGVELHLRFGAPARIVVHRIADSRLTDAPCPLAGVPPEYLDDAIIVQPEESPPEL